MSTQHVHEDITQMYGPRMLTHLLTDHDGAYEMDDLYHAARDDATVRAFHQTLHPEDKPAVVKFRYYLHDGERAALEDFLVSPSKTAGFDPVRADIAKEIAELRPFYEVVVDCEYDTVDKVVRLVKASL